MPPNFPEFSYRSWAERARSRPEFRAATELLSASASATDRLFFGVRTTFEGAAGVYIELYFESASRVLSACMFTFVASEEGFLTEETTRINHIQLAQPMQMFIDLTSSTATRRAIWFDIHLELVEPSATDVSVSNGSAHLRKDYSAAALFDKPKIQSATLPNLDKNLSVFGRLFSGGQIFCPNCSGIGAFDDMAIPRADWESGASGYALYSCNRVSGRVACRVCGGFGGKFKSWYLEEHPELLEVGFAEGSGLLPSSEL